ncbi:acetyl-CoA C-acyltransferase [Sphingomonas panni]|uniref:acetyl-CoA C-acyltransferase n=1 Tax=Sphingomonas panni TaxID=237612 RepID=UPI001F5B7ECA|nr:acetyl-CoA C-acyltransferase [Sphingomonas panni]
MSDAYIVDAVRTPGGRRKGFFSSMHPADLGTAVIDGLLDRTGLNPAAIEDVIVGCVSQTGEQAFAFGRNVVLASRLPQTVPAVTIDRQCGSSQQALHFAAQAVMSGTQDVVVAAGAESMTRVPMGSNYLLHEQAGIGEGPWSRSIRSRFGVEEFSQFQGAQAVADKYRLSRDAMDTYSLESHRRAAAVTLAGAFSAEIVPIRIDGATIDRHEGIRYDASLQAIAAVKPLVSDGTITAANASQMADGALAALVVSAKALREHGLTPIARVHGLSVSAGDPVMMLEEAIPATRKALARVGLTLDDIDLFEVNEAFASIPMAWAMALSVEHDRMNVNGGAIALGHPLGASGTKLLATLVHALRARNLRFGLQAMCEGGGIANVTIGEALY